MSIIPENIQNLIVECNVLKSKRASHENEKKRLENRRDKINSDLATIYNNCVCLDAKIVAKCLEIDKAGTWHNAVETETETETDTSTETADTSTQSETTSTSTETAATDTSTSTETAATDTSTSTETTSTVI